MNAKTEFLEEIAGKKLICAKIGIEEDYSTPKKWFYLKQDYTPRDFADFLTQLDVEYDEGYGGQELFGLILFDDSFSKRSEYDGSEWWSNQKMPTVKEVKNFTDI